jgi:hypothetical protein
MSASDNIGAPKRLISDWKVSIERFADVVTGDEDTG